MPYYAEENIRITDSIIVSARINASKLGALIADAGMKIVADQTNVTQEAGVAKFVVSDYRSQTAQYQVECIPIYK